MVMPMLYFFMWVATKKDKGELYLWQWFWV